MTRANAWSKPETRIVLRGDEHCSNPELMALTLADPDTDFIFGLTGNRTLTPLAEPFLEHNRKAHAVRERAPRRWRQSQNPPPHRSTWPQRQGL